MRRFLLFAFIFFVFLYSCTKIQTTDIGSGLIPPIDGVNTIDTFLEVLTINSLDSDLAKVYKSDEHVIGVINTDPLFGKTTAAAFFELKPTFYKYYFAAPKDSITVDSVVLVLSYRGIYGDSTVNQSLSVYEINNKLKYDSNYNTSDVIGYSNLLGQRNNINLQTLNDSIKPDPIGENAVNQIRIPLSKSFADKLIKSFDTIGTSGSSAAYVSDSFFRENFAGFAVMPSVSSAGEALIRISLSDTNTKLAMYYTYTNAGVRDTTVSYFRFNASGTTETSGCANLISRNRVGSKVSTYFNSPANSDLVFLQTSPGTFAKVTIPALANFPNGIIHRANLVMTQVIDDVNKDRIIAPPRYLLLTTYDNTNRRKMNVRNDFIIDASSGPNITAFGGFVINKVLSSGDYVASYDFNMTRYVQGIVTRKDTSYPLRLYAPSNDSLLYKEPFPTSLSYTTYVGPSSANIIANGRVQLGGGNFADSTRRMRLRIIYSKL